MLCGDNCCTAHFEAKQWKPVEPPFKFPSEEKLPVGDHKLEMEDGKVGDEEEETYYGSPLHTGEHSKPPHTEL